MVHEIEAEGIGIYDIPCRASSSFAFSVHFLAASRE